MEGFMYIYCIWYTSPSIKECYVSHSSPVILGISFLQAVKKSKNGGNLVLFGSCCGSQTDEDAEWQERRHRSNHRSVCADEGGWGGLMGTMWRSDVKEKTKRKVQSWD